MGKKNNFIERSLLGTLEFFKESVYAEDHALQPGLLQARDPRIKTASLLLCVVLVLFVKTVSVLLGLYLFCLALAALSRIRLSFFLKRTWVFIPLFALFIAVPSLFNIVTPGRELLGFMLAGHRLAVTQEGLSGAALFVLRVATSVSFVVLLALTTKHDELLKVLRLFRVPQLFVMTLGMCYRYIYLFVEIIEHTHTAIKSRAGLNLHHTKGRELVTWNMANLWLRSYHLNNQVYNAMLSRGYRGEPQVLTDFRSTPMDWVLLAEFIYHQPADHLRIKEG
jgi:cobalt/nickel transport system permease protein